MAEAKKTTETVVVPLDRESGDTHMFVSLNGKNYRVERGTPVEVPVDVAAIIKNSLEAEAAAYKKELELSMRAPK